VTSSPKLPPQITIRQGRAWDAQDIHRALRGIARSIGASHRISSTPEDIRRYGFGESPAFETLIAEVDGEMAGLCLFFASFSTWKGRPGAYIQDLFVEPRFRKLGIGSKLIRRTAAAVRERGGCYLRLSVDTMNFGAHRFYTRLGLIHSDSERIHAAYGEDFEKLAAEGEEHS
jgi:GNAT superfamily N-acetyltransferase